MNVCGINAAQRCAWRKKKKKKKKKRGLDLEVRIQEIVVDVLQQDDDEAVTSLAQHVLVSRAELEAAPLAVQKVRGQQQQRPSAGGHAVRDAVRDGVTHREIPKVQAQLVAPRTYRKLVS